ncbi:MAG: Maf family protein [Rhodospirillales bacterium]
MTESLVLASGSATRRSLLEAAGVEFLVKPPGVDEEAVKQSLQAEGADAMDAAEALAEVKARQISQSHAGALVIGADQMLDCEGRWFDKPADVAGVGDHLRALRGRRHRLSTAAVICLDGQRIWHQRSEAWLTMRKLSDAFIADYVLRFGEGARSSVGAYRLEREGVQLFTQVSGDHFVILGLPLLPLLGFLRARGVLAT